MFPTRVLSRMKQGERCRARALRTSTYRWPAETGARRQVMGAPCAEDAGPRRGSACRCGRGDTWAARPTWAWASRVTRPVARAHATSARGGARARDPIDGSDSRARSSAPSRTGVGGHAAGGVGETRHPRASRAGSPGSDCHEPKGDLPTVDLLESTVTGRHAEEIPRQIVERTRAVTSGLGVHDPRRGPHRR